MSAPAVAAAVNVTSTHTREHMGNICGHCIKPFKWYNKKHSCLNCHSKFHLKCYKSVNIGNNMCKICLASEMPFFNSEFDLNDINHDHITQVTSNPSTMPDNIFECFKSKGLHFVHVNARSLYPKLSEIRLLAHKCNIAVLCISETWLDASHTDESVEIEGYKVVRRDRLTHAGGVCMYIRNDIIHDPRPDLQNNNLEDLWIQLLLPKTKPIIVGTCYRAPKNNNVIECLESTMRKLRGDCDTFILGDFNICTLKNYNLRNRYLKLLDLNSFKQLITSPTRVTKSSSSIIDHICTNSSNKVSQSGVIESGVSDHFITFCTRKITREQISKDNIITIRSLKNYSQDIFIEKLQVLDWTPVLSCTDVNEAWNRFKVMFTQIINEVAPLKEIRVKHRTEPWINNEILESMRERDKILYHSNRNKSDTDLRLKYNELRNKVTTMCRKAKASYFCNKIEEYKDNPKLLWKHFKSLGYSQKSKGNSKIVLDIDNEKCFDSKRIVEHINDFYINVASNLVSKLPVIPKIFDVGSQVFKSYYSDINIVPKSFKITRVTENFIHKELLNLNPHKSTGIDDIQSKFLKEGANEIKSIITHIINLSIDTNTVPDELKFAKVKPLFKKNSRLDVGNYRPVSILCIVSKILERSVYVQMEKYLNENNIIYGNQSGFRKGFSTDTCLINLTDQIKMQLSQGNFVGMVLLDLQKAFDTVDHDILCNKLEAMGMDFTDWFKSYLGGRQQVVIANDVSSEPMTVKCGVPQGSILGPLLFLCYVNDMPISLKCKLLLYADDSALLVSGSDPNIIAEILSNELKSCRQWLIDNKLSLHLGKTEAILFGSRMKLLKVTSLFSNLIIK